MKTRMQKTVLPCIKNRKASDQVEETLTKKGLRMNEDNSTVNKQYISLTPENDFITILFHKGITSKASHVQQNLF